MKAGDRGKRSVGARKVQHAEPAEAESDGSQLAFVDLIERRPDPNDVQQALSEQGPVADERLHQSLAFVIRPTATAFAIEVDADSSVPFLRQSPRDALLVGGAPRPVREDEDCGQR